MIDNLSGLKTSHFNILFGVILFTLLFRRESYRLLTHVLIILTLLKGQLLPDDKDG